MAVRTPPEGYHTVTPTLIVRDAARAIEFYRRAFGAVQVMRMEDPDGRVLHAEIRIGDSIVMIAEERPEWGNRSPQTLEGSPVPIHLYVDDVDALAGAAVEAGATILIPVADQFYGDRSGRLVDPQGHLWIVSTHREDLTPEELRARTDAFMKQIAGT